MNKVPRIAIVGTGPAGMYAAQHLLARCDIDIEIDLCERLPTPWGLVRAGVAPDHPEKKTIIDRLFRQLLAHPQVRFFGNAQVGNIEIGNVEIGANIGVNELRQWYSAVVFATGANGDRALNIPGEDLPGSFSAREFVGWYNGHPDHRHLSVDLSCKRAVIIGNGNVALDVARILTLPIEVLEKTDIAEHALATLRQSAVEEVVILGRRDARHCAFNTPELEELLDLDDVAFSIEGDRLTASDADWIVQRKLDVLRELSRRTNRPARKRVIFRFFSTPLAISGRDRVENLEIGVNTLQRNADGDERVNTTTARATLSTGLVLRAIGYRGNAIADLPFDTHASVVANANGRVHGCRGVYVTGWIKRGPQGVIGSNKKCARETVDALLDDLARGVLPRSVSREVVAAEIAKRSVRIVDLSQWHRIDRAEREAGRECGRPRVKMTDVAAMLNAAGQPARVA